MIGAIASIMIICLFGIFCYFCFFKKDSYSLPTESVSKTKVQMLCTPDDLEKALKSGVMAEGIAIKPKKKKHSNQENSSSESSSDDDSAASARSNFSQSEVKRIQKGKKVSDQHLTAAIVKAEKAYGIMAPTIRPAKTVGSSTLTAIFDSPAAAMLRTI